MTDTYYPVNYLAENLVLGQTAAGDRVRINAETVRVEGHSRTVLHEPITSWTRLSLTGDVTEKGRREPYQGGQITDVLDEIETFAAGWSRAKVATLASIWNDHHLNDMRAACAHQTPVGDSARERLDKTPPCPISGYRYGSAWLVDPDGETQDAIQALRQLLKEAG
jgi:hypothetical protein